MGGSVPHRMPRPGLGQNTPQTDNPRPPDSTKGGEGTCGIFAPIAAHGQCSARHAPATATAAAVAAQLIVDQPIIAAKDIYVLSGGHSRLGGAYTQRRRRAVNSRFPALPRSGRGGAKPPAPYERPPIQCHIIAGGGGSLGGLGGAAGGGAAKKSPPR